MSEHTPGPWEPVIHPEQKCFPSVVIGFCPGLRYFGGSGSDEHIRRRRSLTINVGPPESNLSSNLMEVCEANARLIAAAPDLLETAKAVYSKSDGLADVSEMQEELITLDEAISKAEGKTQ